MLLLNSIEGCPFAVLTSKQITNLPKHCFWSVYLRETIQEFAWKIKNLTSLNFSLIQWLFFFQDYAAMLLDWWLCCYRLFLAIPATCMCTLYECMPHMSVPPLQISVTTHLENFECHWQNLFTQLNLCARAKQNWEPLVNGLMYFVFDCYTFTSPSLTCRLTLKLSNRSLLSTSDTCPDGVRFDRNDVVAKHCSWRSSLATDRRSRPVGRPPSSRQGWPRGKNGTPFYGVPFFHGEDARTRVGRKPHSRPSTLEGTRAADHLHVGLSRETFADLIGKKAESLP